MSKKSISRFTFLAVFILLMVSFSLAYPASVSAQCGTGQQVSSCKNCHELLTPAFSKSEWHSLHAGKNTCVDCHGGNATDMDKTQAHVGIFANPLTGVYTNCHSCHPSSYQDRAENFGEILHFTPTGLNAPISYNQPLSKKVVENTIVMRTPDTITPSRDIDLSTALILSGGAAVGLIFVSFVFLNFWRHD